MKKFDYAADMKNRILGYVKSTYTADALAEKLEDYDAFSDDLLEVLPQTNVFDCSEAEAIQMVADNFDKIAGAIYDDGGEYSIDIIAGGARKVDYKFRYEALVDALDAAIEDLSTGAEVSSQAESVSHAAKYDYVEEMARAFVEHVKATCSDAEIAERLKNEEALADDLSMDFEDMEAMKPYADIAAVAVVSNLDTLAEVIRRQYKRSGLDGITLTILSRGVYHCDRMLRSHFKEKAIEKAIAELQK